MPFLALGFCGKFLFWANSNLTFVKLSAYLLFLVYIRTNLTIYKGQILEKVMNLLLLRFWGSGAFKPTLRRLVYGYDQYLIPKMVNCFFIQVWLKFNDNTVSEVTWAELSKESVGGHSNTSAYSLVYIDASKPELLMDAEDSLATEEEGKQK